VKPCQFYGDGRYMRKFLFTLCVLLLLSPHLVAGQITQDEQLSKAKALNETACQLYRNGKYAEVKPLYKRSLEICEKKLG
jgi:hypothetical protein